MYLTTSMSDSRTAELKNLLLDSLIKHYTNILSTLERGRKNPQSLLGTQISFLAFLLFCLICLPNLYSRNGIGMNAIPKKPNTRRPVDAEAIVHSAGKERESGTEGTTHEIVAGKHAGDVVGVGVAEIGQDGVEKREGGHAEEGGTNDLGNISMG
jgi:hypothetical protein